MKATEFLEAILKEGFDNIQVQVHDGKGFTDARSFAKSLVGASHAYKAIDFTFDPQSKYALLFVSSEDAEMYDDLTRKADFISDMRDGNGTTVHYFKLS